MYNVLKTVISAGGYKLADIQYKIKKLYTMGDLTEAELDELMALAMAGVTTDAERPEVLQMIQTLAGRLDALEAAVASLTGSSGETTTDYPAWQPWDGISSDYQPGAIVSHGSKVWQSAYDGQNVWEPGTVDDRFWVEYTG